MITAAKKRFKDFLAKHSVSMSFKDEVTKRGLDYTEYIDNTPAIYAIRRLFDLYDGSKYAVLATAWECRVILDRLEPMLDEDIKRHGAENVIRAMRHKQSIGDWLVPDKITDEVPENDDKPLPPIKEVAIVERDSTEDFEFIDLSRASKSRMTLDEHHIRVHNDKHGRYVLLNPEISDLIKSKGCIHLRLRRDTLTNDLHMVLSRDEAEGSCNVVFKKGSRSAVVSSRVLVDFLNTWSREPLGVFSLRISKNLSHNDNIITLKIIRD